MDSEEFAVGDIVQVYRWGMDDGGAALSIEESNELNGKQGPITHISADGQTILVDIGVPGVLMNDLICYPNEVVKVNREENNG